MRSAGVLVAGALNQRKPSFVEDRPQSSETRMKAKLVPGRVAAYLQHLSCGHGQRGPPALIERITIRHEHAERVVASPQIEDDQVSRGGALRPRVVAEKLQRGKAEAAGADAPSEKIASGELHTS